MKVEPAALDKFTSGISQVRGNQNVVLNRQGVVEQPKAPKNWRGAVVSLLLRPFLRSDNMRVRLAFKKALIEKHGVEEGRDLYKSLCEPGSRRDMLLNGFRWQFLNKGHVKGALDKSKVTRLDGEQDTPYIRRLCGALKEETASGMVVSIVKTFRDDVSEKSIAKLNSVFWVEGDVEKIAGHLAAVIQDKEHNLEPLKDHDLGSLFKVLMEKVLGGDRSMLNLFETWSNSGEKDAKLPAIAALPKTFQPVLDVVKMVMHNKKESEMGPSQLAKHFVSYVFPKTDYPKVNDSRELFLTKIFEYAEKDT